ncbi:MAG TPA: magnesium transporter, partial [bacterium (Candidatus Stahlbacteria)]|nr:magnesium transporter [Candidatus Stahlbacteria bacterium]
AEATDIIAELPAKKRAKVIESMPKEEADKVSELLKFKETSAGGIMGTDFIGLAEDLTAEEALKKVRGISLDPNTPYYIYVVDKDQRLLGVLPFRRLVFAPPSEKLANIMNRDVISVNLRDDQEEVAKLVSKYDLLSVPVVDEERHLKGVITADDVMDIIRDEATEDIMRMSGAAVSEAIFTSPRRSAMKRLPWLYLHLGTASITALIIGVYQQTLSAFIALAVFMPLIASVGGSAGVQTLALIVRGIALGEVTFHDTRRLVLKEIAVGLLTGLLIGVFVAIFAYLWKGNPVFGLIIGASFIASQIFACGIGVFTPLTLRKLGIDPALASSPFLSSLIDCVSYFSLLGFATLFLKYLK